MECNDDVNVKFGESSNIKLRFISQLEIYKMSLNSDKMYWRSVHLIN